jgi:Txe/YoeB family toxin of Txe-Axe toxin-antitoxin module
MELICNELAFYPLAEDSRIAEQRFKTILDTFGEASQKYNFTHIRFPLNYSEQQVTKTQNFYEWISTISNNTLRAAILKLFRPPYTDDLEEEVTDRFFESEYEVTRKEAPERHSPVGMPVAFIKSVPSISFDSHPFWRNRKIEINKTNGNVNENATFQVYNVCLPTDIDSVEITEWAENSFPHFIDSAALLNKYLGYQKFNSAFSNDFMEKFFDWKENDTKSFKYLLLLMKDIELHPFTGGMGQTENLKGRGKEASKRINNKYPDGDRLSYTLENNVVTFIACKGHYEFHD